MKMDTIYHNTFHTFGLIDRIRLLFGKKMIVKSEIEINWEARMTGGSKAQTFIEPIFPRKLKK